MNRRSFLGSLAMLTAGMALDPEKALWTPGRKTFFDLGGAPRVLVDQQTGVAIRLIRDWVEIPNALTPAGIITFTGHFR